MPEVASGMAGGGQPGGGQAGGRKSGKAGLGRKPAVAPVPIGPAQEGWWKWGLAAVVASSLVGGKKSVTR